MRQRLQKWKKFSVVLLLMLITHLTAGSVLAAQYTAIGDSLTFGTGASSTATRFTNVLLTQLNAQGGGYTLTNRGEFGAPAPQVLANQLANAIADNPDLVTITVGTNDVRLIAQNQETLTVFDTSLTTILSSLRGGAPNRRILIANVPDLSQLPAADDNPLTPTGGDGYAPNPILKAALTGLVQQVNGIISTRAAEYGVVVVDLFNDPQTYNPANISADGLHPNDAGHALLANKFNISNSLIVTSTGDATGADGVTTLREAIATAATQAGTPVVTFAGNVTGTITLSAGEIGIASSMSIVGPGATALTVSGNNTQRIFNITAGNVQISGLTLSNGRNPTTTTGMTGANGGGPGSPASPGGPGSTEQGGAILNAANLTLTACALTGNNVVGGMGGTGGIGDSGNNSNGGVGGVGGDANGGAIYNTGTLSIIRSTFSNNKATGGPGGTGGAGSQAPGINHDGGGGGAGGIGRGGAIYSTGTLTIENSTFSGNAGVGGAGGAGGAKGSGAGPASQPGAPGAVGGRLGGALFINSGTASIDSATITLNTAANGGGISVAAGTVNLNNSIVAGNTATTNTNIGGSVNSTNSLTAGTPLLAPLANNGGPTQTHALLTGSPAIDTGSTTLTTDQRGLPRPGGSANDMGAFEAHPPVVDLNGAAGGSNNTATFTEDGGAVLLVDAASTLTDIDNANVAEATVTLSAVPNGTAESLTADTTGTSITASYNSGTGVLTLSGSDTLAHYLQVLRTVRYNNTSQDPDTTARTATFSVSDGGVNGTATTTISIVAINDAPVFTKGTDQVVDEDAGPQTVTNWATGISAIEAGQTVSFQVTNDNNGLFSAQPEVAADGTLTYTPAANANGVATVTVTIQDNGGTANGGVDTSTAQTFTITVNAVNDAPVAHDQSVTTAEDTPKVITLTSTDIDGRDEYYSVIAWPAHGILSGGAPNVTYTPNPNYNGTDSFTIRVYDGTDDSNIATISITITPVNDAPVAQNQNVGTAEEAPLPITLTASDIDSASLTFAVLTQPQHGTLSGTAPNLTYTPNTNFSGTDSFTFRASDGSLNSNAATISITVGGTNDAPVAQDDTTSTNNATPVEINVLGNDIDVDDDTLSVVQVATTASTHGTVTINPNGTLRYVPEAGYIGTATFTYTASDGALQSTATVTVTVTASNVAPVAVDDTYTVIDGPLTVAAPGVLDNDTDANGNTLTAAVATQPQNGTLVFNADGSFTYTPASGYTGTDSFTYTVSDGALTDTGTVTLNVQVTPLLTLTVAPATFNENGGPAAAVATLTRNVNFAEPLTVRLGSSDTSEAQVPRTIDIPAGAASVRFFIAAIDDKVPDGDRNVNILAIGEDFPHATATVRVLDNGYTRVPLTLTVNPGTFLESAGQKAAVGQVSIPTPAKIDYAIELSSSDESEVRVPRTVTIRAGRTAASFYVSAVDDSDNDSVESVIITARRLGFGTATKVLEVGDDEQAALVLTIDSATVNEDGSVEATVLRNRWLTSAMTVLLSSSDPSAAIVPASISIPAGRATGSFIIRGVRDSIAGNTRTAVITASRPGLTPGSATVNVVDGSGATSVGSTTSKVSLSTAGANAARGTLSLTFGGGLDADSVQAGNFAVSSAGSALAVESVSYNAASSTVTLVLSGGSLSVGDKVHVAWDGLLDMSGAVLRGRATVTAK